MVKRLRGPQSCMEPYRFSMPGRPEIRMGGMLGRVHDGRRGRLDGAS